MQEECRIIYIDSNKRWSWVNIIESDLIRPETDLVIRITPELEQTATSIEYLIAQIKTLEDNPSDMPVDIIVPSLKKQLDIEYIKLAKQIMFK